MSSPIETFRTEADEHLTTLEDALLKLETDPDNPELIALSFRAMHTIKGAGGMFGFQDLSNFTHHLETAFDKVRNGEYPVGPELVSVLLDSKDHIAGMLEHTEQTPVQALVGQSLLERLHAIIPSDSPGEHAADEDTTPGPQADAAAAANATETAYRIRFTPSATTFIDGLDVLPTLAELHSLGRCEVTTQIDRISSLDRLEPESCQLSWDIVLITERAIDDIQDAFLFVAEEWDIRIEAIDTRLDDADSIERIGDILVDRGVVTPDEIDDVLASRQKTGELLQNSGLAQQKDIDAALNEQRAIREAKDRKSQGEQNAVVRVPAARLDTLMNLVGELVIIQARMNQLAQSRDDEEVMSVAEDLDRLAVDLRDNTFSIRMLPIGTTFGRFSRLVRDLSRTLGKEIRLETEGAETELDKMVLDRLGDPLVHLIRNSIDHGIENPEQRVAAGKPSQGTIRLTAQHAESHVVINIQDDGAGLDPERILAKAVERGLVNADTRLDKDDIQNLIFEPGFSTAKTVSDVSGRGVGMDVVKRSIHDLGGQVTICSQHGHGTTIKIVLPMTLAIIEGLMVSVSDEKYVLPLGAVEECIELTSNDKRSSGEKRLVEIRGELVPYMRLREWFHVEGKAPEIEQIVVTRMGDSRFGFSVDEVIGQYQTVIKRLGKIYEGTVGFAGATILGDGNVAMILDTAGLVEAVELEAA